MSDEFEEYVTSAMDDLRGSDKVNVVQAQLAPASFPRRANDTDNSNNTDMNNDNDDGHGDANEWRSGPLLGHHTAGLQVGVVFAMNRHPKGP